MKIAIAQINTPVGDLEGTCERMLSFAGSAVEQGAELVVFPMAALMGPLPVDYPNREGLQLDLASALERLARSLPCPCLVPVVGQMDGEAYHEVMLVRDGKATPLRMGAYAQYGEGGSSGIDAMRPVPTFELDGHLFALAQTYDDLDDLVDTSFAADVVVFVSDYAYALDDAGSALGAALKESRFRSDALALDAWLVAAGSVGGYGLQVYGGASFVLSPEGELAASAPSFEESLLVAEVRFNKADRAVPGEGWLEQELYNRSLHLWQALVVGLRDYFEKQGRSGAVLVLNGSLASCLLAALATDALGPTRVYALLDTSVEEGLQRVASQIGQALRLQTETCPLDLSIAQDEALRADLIRAYLAHLARQMESVPLDYADKTFLALEATSTVARTAELLPFGDVYRSDLMELAHLRNTISPIIPAEAFANYEVPQIPGLGKDVDSKEQQLKFVDVVLATHIEWERSLSDIAARQKDESACEAVLRQFQATEAARDVSPLCIAASSRPLFTVRAPLGIVWHDHLRSEEERMAGKRAEDDLAELMRNGLALPTNARPGISELMKGLQIDLKASPEVESVDREGMEGVVGEILNLLQDLSDGDASGHPPVEGPFGPLTWGSPFSEN